MEAGQGFTGWIRLTIGGPDLMLRTEPKLVGSNLAVWMLRKRASFFSRQPAAGF